MENGITEEERIGNLLDSVMEGRARKIYTNVPEVADFFTELALETGLNLEIIEDIVGIDNEDYLF